MLRAVQIVLDEGIAQPILIGRPDDRRAAAPSGWACASGPASTSSWSIPSNDPRYDHYWGAYHQLMERRGVTEPTARNLVRTSPTLIAALAVRLRRRRRHDRRRLRPLPHATSTTCATSSALREGVQHMAALSLLVMPTRSLFIADTYVNEDPDAETLAEITAAGGRRGAALRHPAQGGAAVALAASAAPTIPRRARWREAVTLLHQRAPDLEVEGEMHGDAALDPRDPRTTSSRNSRLKGAANLLICPTLDAANIAFNLLKTAADGLHVGPMLLGTALPAHVLTPSVTARGILNMTALAVVEAQRLAEARG